MSCFFFALCSLCFSTPLNLIFFSLKKELGQAFPFHFIGQLPYISFAAGVRGSVSQAQYLDPTSLSRYVGVSFKFNTKIQLKNVIFISPVSRKGTKCGHP